MGNLQPVEIFAMAMVAGCFVFMVAAFVWFAIRTRQAVFAGLGIEERAAQLLGQSLAGSWMTPDGVRKVMTIYNVLDPVKRPLLALAVQGMVNGSDGIEHDNPQGFEAKIVALAETFAPAA
jgi:hypothetical protein